MYCTSKGFLLTDDGQLVKARCPTDTGVPCAMWPYTRAMCQVAEILVPRAPCCTQIMYRQGKAGGQWQTQADFPPVDLLRTSAFVLSPPPAAAKKPDHPQKDELFIDRAKDELFIDGTTPTTPERLRQTLQRLHRLGELSPLSRMQFLRPRDAQNALASAHPCASSTFGPALESSQPPPPLCDDQDLAQAQVVDGETLMRYGWHKTESRVSCPLPASGLCQLPVRILTSSLPVAF
jgi:hypothetical protein